MQIQPNNWSIYLDQLQQTHVYLSKIEYFWIYLNRFVHVIFNNFENWYIFDPMHAHRNIIRVSACDRLWFQLSIWFFFTVMCVCVGVCAGLVTNFIRYAKYTRLLTQYLSNDLSYVLLWSAYCAAAIVVVITFHHFLLSNMCNL